MKTYSRNIKISQESVPKELVNSCRLCLDDVLSSSLTIDGVIKDKIKYCVGLEVENCNDLSSNICKKCSKMIDSFYLFKQMCLSNDVKLHECKVTKKVYSEITGISNTPAKDLQTVTIQEEGDLSLLEDGTVSFLLEEENIHPDAPDDLIFQLKKESATDALHTKNMSEINVEKTITKVSSSNEQVNIPESYRPVVRSRESLSNKPYTCRECKDGFNRADRLILHEKQVHKIERLHCSHCSKSFINKVLFERHMRTHTGCKRFRCNVCSKTFTQKESIIRHFARLHCEKRYECDKCPKRFTSHEGLKSHCFTHHTIRTKEDVYRYKCKYCPKSFCYSSGLSRHLLSHRGVISTCKICQKGFSDASCLRRHLLAIHHRIGQV